MSDYVVPPPEPKEVDEQNWAKLQVVIDRAVLKGKPPMANGEKCGNCLYYLNTDDDISYCWHPELRILVGFDWWCQWWEEIPAE